MSGLVAEARRELGQRTVAKSANSGGPGVRDAYGNGADTERSPSTKEDVEALVGVLHQATVENQILRQQLAQRAAIVHALPPSASAVDGPRLHGR
ncbi:hypothetical protein [Streptomyces griseoluteus]